MGIPSYFRHILSRYPKLLAGASHFKPTKSDVLLVDFNCLIYGCIKSPKLPTYTKESTKEWEKALIGEIKDYVILIWNTAGRPKTVLLAVDGVVPMAKIRQQRLRRFKSAWLGNKERELGLREESSWDTNSITPGTEFMEHLSRSLHELCAERGAGWTLNGAEEFGEGEQKLMAWVRAHSQSAFDNKQLLIYGLDADLILLSILHAGYRPSSKWGILRESQEFGKGTRATDPFLVMSVNGLMDTMFPIENLQMKLQHIHDYIGAMSMLGNDFVPHSLGFTIRDAGHDRLIECLNKLHRDQKTLTESKNGRILLVKSSVQYIMEVLAQTEEDDISAAFSKKYTMRSAPPKTDAERTMLPIQNLPLEWKEEARLWNGKMHDDWRDRYYIESNDTLYCSQYDIHEQCISYSIGIQWVLDYYTGSPISTEWMYPSGLPPLWKDLVTFIKGVNTLPSITQSLEVVLQPQEQLAMVLPLESWGLIRNAKLKQLPALMPAFWPKQYGFHSLGKRWFWECYPNIPIINIGRLRFCFKGTIAH